MSPSRRHDTLDERVARLILSLHHHHPNLGHNGLLEALKQDGILVDSEELEQWR